MAKPTDARIMSAIKKQLGSDGMNTDIPALAEDLGATAKEIVLDVWRLEPEAVPRLKFKANKGNIVKARRDGVRWERIASRTGVSVSEAQSIGGQEAADAYTGRGSRGNSGGTKKAASGRRQAQAKSQGTSGRRQGAQKGQAGRKPRARTRAERAAKAGNPS
jgi:hypothetical protein